MNFCYKHPNEIAVAKIQREILQHTPEGDKQITVISFVCQECADGARSIGTPLFPPNYERH